MKVNSGLGSATPAFTGTPHRPDACGRWLSSLRRRLSAPHPHGDARGALTHTRALLARVAEICSAATSLDDALCEVMDTACDAAWPVGHVYTVRNGRFVDSGLWSSQARTTHPRFVETMAATVGEVPCDASRLAIAMCQARDPIWSSVAAGTPELGSLAHACSPGRVHALDQAGLLTQIAGPVAAEGQVVAMIELFSPRRHDAAPDELETLRLICSLLSGVADRVQVARTLQDRDQLLRGVMRALPDTLVVYDPSTREVVEYHPGPLMQRTRESGTGSTIDHMHATARLDWQGLGVQETLNLLSSGKPVTFTLRGTGPEDPDRPCELVQSTAVVGGRELAFLFVRDVSERDRAERNFQDATSRAQSLLDIADAGIFELDDEHRILYANSPGCDLVGLDGDELLGKRLDDLVPFLHPALAQPPPCAGTGHGTVRRYAGQLAGSHPSGGRAGTMTISAAVSCRQDPAGRHRQIVTLSDVTAAESGARLAAQHAHAIDINDSVVQGVTTALYGLELGDVESAVTALQSTLAEAKQTVAALLSESGITPEILRAVAARTPHRATPQTKDETS